MTQQPSQGSPDISVLSYILCESTHQFSWLYIFIGKFRLHKHVLSYLWGYQTSALMALICRVIASNLIYLDDILASIGPPDSHLNLGHVFVLDFRKFILIPAGK